MESGSVDATLGSAYWYGRAYVQRRSKVSLHLGLQSEMTAVPCQRSKIAQPPTATTAHSVHSDPPYRTYYNPASES